MSLNSASCEGHGQAPMTFLLRPRKRSAEVRSEEREDCKVEPYGEEEGYPQDFNQETDSRQKEMERQANSYFSQQSVLCSGEGLQVGA